MFWIYYDSKECSLCKKEISTDYCPDCGGVSQITESGTLETTGSLTRSNEETRNVWLPRQDQLQDMIGDDSGFYNQLDHFRHMLAMSIQEIGHGLTYEKIWLKVVMRKKYHKIWDGKEWKCKR